MQWSTHVQDLPTYPISTITFLEQHPFPHPTMTRAQTRWIGLERHRNWAASQFFNTAALNCACLSCSGLNPTSCFPDYPTICWVRELYSIIAPRIMVTAFSELMRSVTRRILISWGRDGRSEIAKRLTNVWKFYSNTELSGMGRALKQKWKAKTCQTLSCLYAI
jgi:hypothetical protein